MTSCFRQDRWALVAAWKQTGHRIPKLLGKFIQLSMMDGLLFLVFLIMPAHWLAGWQPLLPGGFSIGLLWLAWLKLQAWKEIQGYGFVSGCSSSWLPLVIGRWIPSDDFLPRYNLFVFQSLWSPLLDSGKMGWRKNAWLGMPLIKQWVLIGVSPYECGILNSWALLWHTLNTSTLGLVYIGLLTF